MLPTRYIPGQSSAMRKSRLEGKPSLLPKPRRPGSTDRLSSEARRPSTTGHRSSSAEPRGTFGGTRLSREASATKLQLNGRSRSQQSERMGQSAMTPLRGSHYSSRPTTTPVRTPSEDRASRSWQTSLDRALAFVTIKDQRPISNAGWQRAECARVQEALARRCGADGAGLALIRPLTIARFVDVTGAFLAAIMKDAKLNNDNYVTKLPHLSKRLLYPGTVSKSWLKTVNTLHAFPHALALIAYLLDLAEHMEMPVSDDWLYVGKDELACLRRDYLYKCWIRFQDPGHQFEDLNEEYLQNLKLLLGNDEEKIMELQHLIKKYEACLEDEAEAAARADEARRVERRDALLAALRAERAARRTARADAAATAAAVKDHTEALRQLDVEIERATAESQQLKREVEQQPLTVAERTRLLDDVDYARRVQDSKRALAHQIDKVGGHDSNRAESQQLKREVEQQPLTVAERTRLLDDVDYARRVQDSKRALAHQIDKVGGHDSNRAESQQLKREVEQQPLTVAERTRLLDDVDYARRVQDSKRALAHQIDKVGGHDSNRAESQQLKREVEQQPLTVAERTRLLDDVDYARRVQDSKRALAHQIDKVGGHDSNRAESQQLKREVEQQPLTVAERTRLLDDVDYARRVQDSKRALAHQIDKVGGHDSNRAESQQLKREVEQQPLTVAERTRLLDDVDYARRVQDSKRALAHQIDKVGGHDSNRAESQQLKREVEQQPLTVAERTRLLDDVDYARRVQDSKRALAHQIDKVGGHDSNRAESQQLKREVEQQPLTVAERTRLLDDVDYARRVQDSKRALAHQIDKVGGHDSNRAESQQLKREVEQQPLTVAERTRLLDDVDYARRVQDSKRALAHQIDKVGGHDSNRAESQQLKREVEQQPLTVAERTRLLDDVDYARRVQDSKRALAHQIDKMLLSKETELALWQKKTLDSCVEYKQGLIHLSAQFPDLASLAIDEKELMGSECAAWVSRAVDALRSRSQRLLDQRVELAQAKNAHCRRRAMMLEETLTKISELKSVIQREQESLDTELSKESAEASSWAAEQRALAAGLEALRAHHEDYARVHSELDFWEKQDAAWRSKLSAMEEYILAQQPELQRAAEAARTKRLNVFLDAVRACGDRLGE